MDLADALNKFYYDMSLYELRLMNNNTLYPDINYNSLLYLNLIYYNKDCTASYLADILHITKSAVTIKVNELIRQGFVTKTQSETDKRVKYLALAPDIAEDFALYDERLLKTVEHIAPRYTKDELALLGRMLDDIRKEYKNLDL